MKIITKSTITVPKIAVHKNVAAYCRVSTQQEIQHHSLKAQQQYYEKLIRDHPGWIFSGIYADHASGRHNTKMKAFQQMMSDCREKKIDLILVKSISRMGRNTVQFLQACEELNQLGVEVYFEVEKLYISNPKTVQLLTIHASVFQNESESKSSFVTWGIRARFENGTSALASRPCYGYRQTEYDILVPIPEEAEIVQLIFGWRQQGMSLRKIANALADIGIKSPRGRSNWSIETIRKILNNEKYYGSVLLQKTYISNYFTGKQSLNNGVLPKYLIEEHHMPIIERD